MLNNKLLICVGGLLLATQGTILYCIRDIHQEQQLQRDLFALPNLPQSQLECDKLLIAIGEVKEDLVATITEIQEQTAVQLLSLEEDIKEIKDVPPQPQLTQPKKPKINITTRKRGTYLSAAEIRKQEQIDQSRYNEYKEEKKERKNRRETIRFIEEQLDKERELGLEEKRLETIGDIKRGGSSLIFDYRD